MGCIAKNSFKHEVYDKSVKFTKIYSTFEFIVSIDVSKAYQNLKIRLELTYTHSNFHL